MVWLRRMYARPLFVVVGILGALLARFPPPIARSRAAALIACGALASPAAADIRWPHE